MHVFPWFSHLCTLWQEELGNLANWPVGTGRSLVDFVNYFPILLSLAWSFSALCMAVADAFRIRLNRDRVFILPSFSILIPFHGDADAVMRTVKSLAGLTPVPEEIVLVDDGSPEGSPTLDEEMLPPLCRVLTLEENLGKAEALNRGFASIRSELVVCMDADTVAESTDWTEMLRRFALAPNLGALTGKIWPAKVGNFVQLFQAIDYLAVICLVKCAETIWGGLMTVSGAWTAYRRQAMLDCHGWNARTSAEDIDLSWRLQARGWQLGYDSMWTARVEMAGTWRKLWLQRRRWASGMGRTMREQILGIFRHGSRHVPVAFMAILSTAWIVLTLGGAGIWLIAWAVNPRIDIISASIAWWKECHVPLYAAVFFVQLWIAVLVDRGPWTRYPLLLLMSPLYPAYFWMVLATSFVGGVPKGFLRLDSGRWKPTAGVR